MQIKDAFHLDRIDAYELHAALTSRFPWARLDDPGERIVYMGKGQLQGGDQYALKLRWARRRDGEPPDSIEPGPQLEPEDVDNVRLWIEEHVLADHGGRVRREILFSWGPVYGAWRYRDVFQMMPPPPEAPLPGFLLARHPLVIEVAFPNSTDVAIRRMRYGGRLREIALLLSLFLAGGVDRLGPVSRNHWSFVDANGEISSKYLSEGYFIPGFEAEQPDFSELGKLPQLDVVEDQEYYGRSGSSADRLDVPSSLESLFDTYFALEHGARAISQGLLLAASRAHGVQLLAVCIVPFCDPGRRSHDTRTTASAM